MSNDETRHCFCLGIVLKQRGLMKNMNQRLFAAGASLFLLTVAAAPQTAKPKCHPPGTEVPFAKVMNEAFAADYVGCDITSKVEFVAAGGTPSYSWGLKGTTGKAPFRIVVPGQQVGGGGPFDLPPHAFIAKDKAEVIFSFRRGDLLILRGAPSVSAHEIAFIATDVRKVK
jgi:hypothetical protein